MIAKLIRKLKNITNLLLWTTLNLHDFSVPGLWRATQQPAGVHKICILVCKLLGVKILCCVPRVMPDMWKRSIICKEQRASSCCRKQFEKPLQGAIFDVSETC